MFCHHITITRVLTVISDAKANVRDIDHERAFLLSNVLNTQPILSLDTNGNIEVNVMRYW